MAIVRTVSLAAAALACALWALQAAAQTTAPAAPAPEAATGRTAKQAGIATRYMVAAANPLATEAGREMLRAGGSAVDAAIAVQLVLNLVEPQSSGIGGGAFLVHWSQKDRRILTLDGREVAPAAATPDRFMKADGKPMAFYEAVVGGRSVGVPGTPRLLAEAHKRWGKLPWARLFEPAIRLAEQGFSVSPRLSGMLAQEKHLATNPAARALFFDGDGKGLAVGTVLSNAAFARTLRTLAESGADAFYAGAIAEDIVATAKAHPTNPGDITLADLAGYKVVEREAVCAPYRVYTVCGMGPPSSGAIAVQQMLGIMENRDVSTVADLLTEARQPIKEFVNQTDRVSGQIMADHDYVDDLVKTLPDAYQVLARNGIYGDYFGFYLCDAVLKVNGKGGQPVYVKLAGQDTGRCTPK